MNELTLKLKNEIIKQLTKNKHNVDDTYIICGDMSYTRKELASEIKKETEFGIKMLADMVMLAIDITSRQRN